MTAYQYMRRRLTRRRRAILFVCAIVLVPGCAELPLPPAHELAPLPHPVRFLLTFDDGPSMLRPFNPSSEILDRLASNAVQPRIKALFFIQTRIGNPTGTAIRLALLRRMHAEGHSMGFHSSSPRGHINHRALPPGELEQSITDGMEDIRSIRGADPLLVRPPYWSVDQRTMETYRRRGLHMLLTDISARDGKIHGWNISLRRRSHFRGALAQVREDILSGRMPLVDGVYPVVITFHDTNTFTARHMEDYLSILTEESARVGVTLAQKPFYDQTAEMEAAAFARREGDGQAGAQP